MRSFKSNENIHKKEGGSYYVVSANKASSVKPAPQTGLLCEEQPGFNCWFSFAPVLQWCCSTPQGSPGIGRNTFLSSPHLCFIIVFNGDLFVSRDDPLMS